MSRPKIDTDAYIIINITFSAYVYSPQKDCVYDVFIEQCNSNQIQARIGPIIVIIPKPTQW